MAAYMGFIMVVSFVVDLLLLCGTDRLLGMRTPPVKSLPGAALGSAYAGVCLLQIPDAFSGVWVRLAVLFFMALVTYGLHIRKIALFILLMRLIGGITTAYLGIGPEEIIICAVCVVVVLITGKRAKADLIPMSLTYGDRTMEIYALHDTGNGLRDPISGEAVIVVSPQVAFTFTGLTKQQLSQPTESLERLPGSRLIPYHAVGTDKGFLLAVRFPSVKFRGRSGSALVAFAPAGFQMDGRFQALVGRID